MGTGEKMAITKTERDHMMHALGLNYGKASFRNHFVTDHDGPDGIVWEGLVERGLAEKRGPDKHHGGMTVYHVTPKGVASLTQEPARDV